MFSIMIVNLRVENEILVPSIAGQVSLPSAQLQQLKQMKQRNKWAIWIEVLSILFQIAKDTLVIIALNTPHLCSQYKTFFILVLVSDIFSSLRYLYKIRLLLVDQETIRNNMKVGQQQLKPFAYTRSDYRSSFALSAAVERNSLVLDVTSKVGICYYVSCILYGTICYYLLHGCQYESTDLPQITCFFLLICGYIGISVPVIIFWAVLLYQPVHQETPKQTYYENYSSRDHGLHSKHCCICLQDYIQNGTIAILPCDRKHFFHPQCIADWTARNNCCPICKRPLPQPQPQ